MIAAHVFPSAVLDHGSGLWLASLAGGLVGFPLKLAISGVSRAWPAPFPRPI
jgi:hypothetical protein